jgi:RNA polymerase sigma-70 factor (ECF subfamily)
VELFARYKDPVYAFFARRLARKDRAEDLTQEAFLAVWGAAKRYEPRASVRSYLFAIAFRILMVERRKAREADAPVPADLSSPAPGAEESIWIRAALARLDDSEREVLMLREYEQLSYAEIAEMLKLPLNTVRSRLFRSREALRTMLQEA